jgi:para-nitrobenzyl esterase
VVVVTLNYRVGAFGFLPIGSPTGDSCANAGLLDQIAALAWVRREIEAFGGDPGRVTVFGESAGAGSIAALLAMPAARGLLRRAILQSPAPDAVLSREEGAARARLLVEKLGGEAPEEAPVERILAAQQACIAAGPHRTGMFFAPVVDGDSLPLRPLEAVARGDARDIAILIGTTEEEMQLYATIPGLGDFPDEVLRSIAASRLTGSASAREALADRAIALYRAELQPRTRRELFFALETDLSLRVPSTRLAASQSAYQAATYMYLFQWRSPLPDGHGGELGACHALDLPFTFGTLDGKAARTFATGDREELQAKARALSQNVMDSWIAFARTGDPSHPGVGAWPRYDSTRRATMLLGGECRAVDAPLEARRAIWGD